MWSISDEEAYAIHRYLLDLDEARFVEDELEIQEMYENGTVIHA